MKRPIALISTESKSPRQLVDELWEAFLTFKRVSKQAIDAVIARQEVPFSDHYKQEKPVQGNTITLPNDNDETRYEFAVNLVNHLCKIGQIKEKPTEAEMRACWEKLKNEKRLSEEGRAALKTHLQEIGQLHR